MRANSAQCTCLSRNEKMTPNKAFGEVLRAIRKKRCKTQAKLAEDADLDRTYISLLETGQRSPTLDTIWALCAALNVNASEVLAKTKEEMEKEK